MVSDEVTLPIQAHHDGRQVPMHIAPPPPDWLPLAPLEPALVARPQALQPQGGTHVLISASQMRLVTRVSEKLKGGTKSAQLTQRPASKSIWSHIQPSSV